MVALELKLNSYWPIVRVISGMDITYNIFIASLPSQPISGLVWHKLAMQKILRAWHAIVKVNFSQYEKHKSYQENITTIPIFSISLPAGLLDSSWLAIILVFQLLAQLTY